MDITERTCGKACATPTLGPPLNWYLAIFQSVWIACELQTLKSARAVLVPVNGKLASCVQTPAFP